MTVMPVEATSLARERAGLFALGEMTDADFDRRLQTMSATFARLVKVKDTVLKPGEDYDAVPGTNKNTLLKPGAERLCVLFSLAPAFKVERIVGDGEHAPDLSYVVTCSIHRGDTDGPVIAEGVGACNSWEKKYRYRQSERECPACSKVGSIRKSTFPPKGSKPGTPPGWWCRECRADWPVDDPAIVGQQRGEVSNPDPYDTDNTLVKMAKKRAHVDAVLTATASSGMFTQDMEEKDDPKSREEEHKRLMDDVVKLFGEARMPGVERTKAVDRLMGTPLRGRKLSLAELRTLKDRIEQDAAVSELRHKNAPKTDAFGDGEAKPEAPVESGADEASN